MDPTLTVLVVDDEPTNLSTFNRAFRKDFKVLTALSGAEALELLEREAVDVLLVDYRMPRMDGLEVLAAARARWPRAVRALLTAHADAPGLCDAQRDGLCAAVLAKPWSHDALLAWVRRAAAERAP
ncbi:MAG: response regulator [Deltaproteobacteria bacterium]|nr:response regulator [Deltaproteobacteria bacterium]